MKPSFENLSLPRARSSQPSSDPPPPAHHWCFWCFLIPPRIHRWCFCAGSIVYSSNTMAVSKWVVLTHGNFIAMCELFARFEGIMTLSQGQAALLTFCSCIGLASVGLIPTITVLDIRKNWFWITALRPLA
ncbi:uncharacterized protein LOC108961088 [Eucalyptus grandis]|uniref:uncharacterized protein LOC108961088 n=1 Tax=Eucalyptus grandis TaxID=71139 RepID=UPI00192EF79F|nr:uncharacterized protein LOC108961088 [Eucalyptus grandis]